MKRNFKHVLAVALITVFVVLALGSATAPEEAQAQAVVEHGWTDLRQPMAPPGPVTIRDFIVLGAVIVEDDTGRELFYADLLREAMNRFPNVSAVIDIRREQSFTYTYVEADTGPRRRDESVAQARARRTAEQQERQRTGERLALSGLAIQYVQGPLSPEAFLLYLELIRAGNQSDNIQEQIIHTSPETAPVTGRFQRR